MTESEFLALEPWERDKVGRFEPWMAGYLAPNSPSLSEEDGPRLLLEYRRYKKETGRDPGFESWLKALIAAAISELFQEEG